MARIKKMSTVTNRGDRLEMLTNLSKVLANEIDKCSSTESEKQAATMPQLVKQYRETLREIQELEGAEPEDDEIAEILSNRAADGKPGAVRKNRSGV